MTVPSQTNRDQQVGNGVTTVFTVPFRILDQTHIEVLRTISGVTTTLVLTTDYTVSGVGGANTTVTFVAAPAAGATLTFLRNVPLTQETDYVPNDPFPAESHERALDKLTMIAQQQEELIDRSMTLPPQVSGVSTELPAPVANTLFGWNPGANAIQNFPLSSIATSIVYGNKLYDIFAGTGAQTVFTLTQDPGSLGNLNISIDGATQVPGTDYTYLATALTFTAAPANGAVILVRYDVALPTGVTNASAVNFLQAGTGAVTRTSQNKARERVSVMDFMGDDGFVDGVTDIQPAAQKAANYLMSRRGGEVFFPNAHYKAASSIVADRSSDSTKGRVSFVGESEYGTWIEYTGSGVCFDIRNNDTALGEQSASYQKVSNMLITGQGMTGTGISLNLASFLDLENLNIQGFQYGIDGIDVDQSLFHRIKARFNSRGIRLRKNPAPGVSSTQPNNVTFLSCNLSNNNEYAAHITGGSCLNFIGGSCENNGAVGAAGFGIKLQDCGYEGGVGGNFVGTYFESNNGVADLVLDGHSGSALTGATHNLTGVSFNRASATNISTNCIKADFGAAGTHGLQKLNLAAVSFKSFGAYTPNAGRPYIAFADTAANKDDFYQVGCLYEDAVETPTFLQNLNKRYAKLTKAADQSLAGTGVAATWLVDTNSSNYSWSPGIASGVVTIDEAGYYAIDCFAVFSSAAAGLKKVLFYKNGTIVGYNEGSQDAVTAATTERFAAGDTLTVQMSQATGGAINIVASLSKLGIVKLFD